MAVTRIYKGMPVVFNHDEFGWVRGVAVRPSPNGEEWLVKNRFGRFWIHVTRLRPAETATPEDAA